MLEYDPNGLKPNEPGAKLDDGKLRVFSILREFPRALRAVAVVGTYGAKKYSLGGWTSVPNGIERYSDAEGRHLLKQWEGEVFDPDSELEHAAHRLWNALAAYELELRERENKQRKEQGEEASASSSKEATISLPKFDEFRRTLDGYGAERDGYYAIVGGYRPGSVIYRVQESGEIKSMGELEAVQNQHDSRNSSLSGCEKKPSRTPGGS